jgi:hypothetical protein
MASGNGQLRSKRTINGTYHSVRTHEQSWTTRSRYPGPFPPRRWSSPWSSVSTLADPDCCRLVSHRTGRQSIRGTHLCNGSS